MSNSSKTGLSRANRCDKERKTIKAKPLWLKAKNRAIGNCLGRPNGVALARNLQATKPVLSPQASTTTDESCSEASIKRH